MDYKISAETIEDIEESIASLESLLTDRIVDLHKVRGGVQGRHAYILYRNTLMEVKQLLKDNLRKV